jgi:hypothetical protein
VTAGLGTEASARKDADVAAQSTLLEEVEMLLHLPIAILAMLSLIAISDALPRIDIEKECRFGKRIIQSFRPVLS